jgi:EpsD family peptidyl-prolyl cis-trans isomerase
MNSKHNLLGRRPGAMSLGLLALAACAVLLVGCGDKQEKLASQTAAKVNKDEITVHQINFMLQQQRGLRPEQADAAGRQILERLIDQQLALEKADDLKLDREPRVVQQLEAAKREILARAYFERVGESAAKPTPEEIKKYYDEKPALFKQRRIYQLQELAIEATAEQLPVLREKLANAKNIADFIEYMKSEGIRFNGNQAVRAAEQLPLPSLERFAQMKDGQALVNVVPTGLQVIVLAGSRSQPVSEEQARPAIEQFLNNDRRRQMIADDVKALRSAAKIEYVGKYGEPLPAGAAGAASAAGATPLGNGASVAPPATAAPAASGGLNAADISKGMGLK